MDLLRTAFAILCTTVALDAIAAVTTTVVDLAVGATTQRILYVRPDNPVANLVMLPGGSGTLGIQDDGRMTTRVSDCSPIIRTQAALAARGIALAFVDSGPHAGRQAAIRYMRTQADVPTWVTGGSSSTLKAAETAIAMQASEPVGLLLGSPELIDADIAALIRVPTLVVFHPLDSSQSAFAVFNRLTGAPAKRFTAITGGTNTGCGYHLFQGAEDALVAATAGFMEEHSTWFGSSNPGEATAVEYYHAGLDHYFVTHSSAEIAALDGGALQGWARTGQSFKVYTAAGAGTSPVCRYYIPPDAGNSHFYGRGTVECEETGRRFPSFVNEDPQFFHIKLPTVGVCPAGTRNVHRAYSNRADANHRYTIDPAIRDQMTGRGWIAEGEGPDIVVMCAPA